MNTGLVQQIRSVIGKTQKSSTKTGTVRIEDVVRKLTMLTCSFGLMLTTTDTCKAKNMPLDQSRKFAAGMKIREPLKDGFFAVDLKVPICDDGKYCSSKSATAIDRKNDSVLNEWIKQNKPDQQISKIKQLLTLAKSVSETFTPSPPISDAEFDDWYEQYCSSRVGEHILLGEFIAQHRGACQQRALLLKAACDSSHFDCALVPGYDVNGGRHVWCEISIDGVDKIFDPTWHEYLVPVDDPKRKSAEQTFGDQCAALFQLLPSICNATVRQDAKVLVPAYEELLKIDETIFGEHSLEASIDHHNLARPLWMDGQHQEAISHAERAWQIQATILGEQNEHTLQSAALLNLFHSKRK